MSDFDRGFIADIVSTVADEVERRLALTTTQQATVLGVGSSGGAIQVEVVCDGETASTWGVAVGDTAPAEGERVLVLFVPPASALILRVPV